MEAHQHTKVHAFQSSVAGITPPRRFTFPFHYTPHPLCVKAAEEVQAYLRQQTAWTEELQRGKMFGVLVVETQTGELGYLAAFSGNLLGENQWDFFVPPIYDLLRPGSYFPEEEQRISAINQEIARLQTDPHYTQLRTEVERITSTTAEDLRQAKHFLKTEKQRREALRQAGVDEATAKALIQESQFQKAEYKRLERRWQAQLIEAQQALSAFEEQITALKQERKRRSAALQQWLFEQYQVLNARGERKPLTEIFAPTPQGTPPAGAGECAAPKLLQYAYLHHLKPRCMAEFWWGDSPKQEIRQHGNYYPACKGKCEPILGHMLQGLSVDPNPLLTNTQEKMPIEIVYEDDWLLVVNKPAGILSVPGKEAISSMAEQLHVCYPEAEGPMIVHRLDMATSGLLLVAKQKTIHQQLQAQFHHRTIRKRYIALLEGIVTSDQGTISLPLAPDLLDRPRQRVDQEQGKPAITDYEVLSCEAGHTRIAFYPHTGRTHQLRVHAAHPEGLGCPIMGDTLYGHPADRLYLHAESLTFTHPITHERITVVCPSPF